MTAQGNRRLRLSLNNLCSRPTKTHPSVQVKKNIKNMKQSQKNFEEIRLALLLFLPLSPKHASHSQALPSHLSNPENNRENRKKAWFFLVPEGRFSGEQEGDSWWDENNGLKCRKPVFMRVSGIYFIKVRPAAHVSSGCKSRIRPVVGRI